MAINQKSFIVLISIAFVFYCCVNFVYFPLKPIFGDETRFIAEAVKLANTGEFWVRDDRAWEMPLTAIVYSGFYSIFKTQESLIVFVRLFQSLLLIVQAFLLYKISMKIFEDRLTAFATFVIVLFYPFFVFYQGLLLSETIFITILIGSFYYIYEWYSSEFKINKSFFLANFFLVLSIYSKGTLSLLPPLLMTIFLFVNTRKLAFSLKVFIYSSIVYVVLLSPWWVRNYQVLNQFVPFTTSSGMNLYLGNNPYNKSGGSDWGKDANGVEVTKIFSIEDEIKQNGVFKDKAVNYIKENPNHFLQLAWLKLKRFYNVIPNAEDFNKGFYKYLSLFSYGVILVLAILSIWVYRSYWQKLSAIYILIGYFTLLHVVFIASLRYRLPLEAFLIVLAAPIFINILKKIKVIRSA